jgi:hypothetical protein
MSVKQAVLRSRPAGGYLISYPLLFRRPVLKPKTGSRPLTFRAGTAQRAGSTGSRYTRGSTARPVLGPLRTKSRTII